jgi:hypothetical protein
MFKTFNIRACLEFRVSNHYCPVKNREIAVVFDDFRNCALEKCTWDSEVPVK